MNGLANGNRYARQGVRVVKHISLHQHNRTRQTIGDASLDKRRTEIESEFLLNGLLSNNVLSALPAEDFARLCPHLEPAALIAGDDLYDFDEKLRFAYFPESAVLSHLYTLADGNTTEAAMIGKEGVVGLSEIFNACPPLYSTRVLVGGSALKIASQTLKQEFGRGGAIQRSLLTYASARMAHLSSRVVCNSRHTVEARLCSWLLMVHDRVGEDKLSLTHEQIAVHLGARRAGISTAACALRDRGVISYSRGQICILDRRMLEAAACECYRMLKPALTA